MKQRFTLILLLAASLCFAQTTTTLAKMRSSSGTSASTAWNVGGKWYRAEPTDKWSPDDGISVIVNKAKTRYYLQVPFQLVPAKPVDTKPIPTKEVRLSTLTSPGLQVVQASKEPVGDFTISFKDYNNSIWYFNAGNDAIALRKKNDQIEYGYVADMAKRELRGWETGGYVENISERVASIGAGDGSGWLIRRQRPRLELLYNGVTILSVNVYQCIRSSGIFFGGTDGDVGKVENVVITPLQKTGISDFDNNEINFADVKEFSSVHTKGSIAKDGNVLTVNDASGIPVGATIQIGTDSKGSFFGRPFGNRGTPGPGGWNYEKTYPTKADMLADETNEPNRLAIIEETGEVGLWRADGFWDIISRYRNKVGVQEGPAFWEVELGLGRTLKAIVLANNGKRLTISKTSKIDVDGATVAVLNDAVFKDFARQNQGAAKTVTLPNGRYAVSEPIGLYLLKDGVIKANRTAKDSCVLYVLPGNQGIKMTGNQSPGLTIKDIDFENNYNGTGGYGMPDDVPQFGFPNKLLIVDLGVRIGGGSVGAKVIGCRFKNLFTPSCWIGSPNGLVEFNEFTFEYECKSYGGWVCGASDGADNTIIRNNRIISKMLIPGYEAFGAKNVLFQNNYGENVLHSSNSAPGTRFIGERVRLGKYYLPFHQRAENPLFNFNSNTGRDGTYEGGLMEDCVIEIEGYADQAHNVARAVVVNDNNHGSIIRNNKISMPDHDPRDGWYTGNQGIISTAKDVEVSGNAITGIIPYNPEYPSQYSAHIGVSYGVVKDNVAEVIVLGKDVKESGNKGNVMRTK